MKYNAYAAVFLLLEFALPFGAAAAADVAVKKPKPSTRSAYANYTDYFFDVALVAGMSVPFPTYSYASNATNSSGSVAGAFGAIVAYRPKPKLGLEGGLFNVGRNYDLGANISSNNFISHNITSMVEIHTLLRYQLFPAFSVGLGGFYGRYGSTPSAGVKDHDLGLVGSLRWNIIYWDFGAKLLGTEVIGFPLVDVRYLLSLMDSATNPVESIHFSELQVYVGFGFAH